MNTIRNIALFGLWLLAGYIVVAVSLFIKDPAVTLAIVYFYSMFAAAGLMMTRGEEKDGAEKENFIPRAG